MQRRPQHHPGSELDVSMLTFADHDAQLEAIEVSLMERNNAEEAARTGGTTRSWPRPK